MIGHCETASSRMNLRPKRNHIGTWGPDAKRLCITPPKQSSEECIFSDGDSEADQVHQQDYEEYTGTSPRSSVITSDHSTDDEFDAFLTQGTDETVEDDMWVPLLRALTPSCLPDSDQVMDPLPSLDPAAQGDIILQETDIEDEDESKLQNSVYFRRLSSALDTHILLEKPGLLNDMALFELDGENRVPNEVSLANSIDELNKTLPQVEPIAKQVTDTGVEQVRIAIVAEDKPISVTEVSNKKKKKTPVPAALGRKTDTLITTTGKSTSMKNSQKTLKSTTSKSKSDAKVQRLQVPAAVSKTLASVADTTNPNTANIDFLSILNALTPPRPAAALEGEPRLVVGPNPLDVFYNKEGGSFLYCGLDLCGKQELLASKLRENSENMSCSVQSPNIAPVQNSSDEKELPLDCRLVFEDGTPLPQEEQQYLQFAKPPAIGLLSRRVVLRFRLNKVSNNYNKRCLCLEIRVRGCPSFGSVITTPVDVRSKRKTMSAAVRNKITMDSLVGHWNQWAEDPNARC